MPEPRLTFIVTGTADPQKTITSIDMQSYSHRAVVAIGDSAFASKAAALAGESVDVSGRPDKYSAGDFLSGRTKNWTPFSVQGLSGDFKPADALNVAIRETKSFTEIFVPVVAGDEIRRDGAERIVEAFAEDEQVGAVWCDYWLGNLRIFEEPYDRTRLLYSDGMSPRAVAIGRKPLEQAGLFDASLTGAEYFDLWLRLSERFIITHLPEALFRVVEQRPKASTQAVQAAKARVNHRVTHA